MKKLDNLTNEEARMAIAQNLQVTQEVNENVAVLIGGTQIVFSRSPN